MEEYKDGSFGPIRKASELKNRVTNENVKTVHFGTEDELRAMIRKRKDRKGLLRRIEQLEADFDSLRQILEAKGGGDERSRRSRTNNRSEANGVRERVEIPRCS